MRGGRKLHVQIVGEGGIGHQKLIPGFSALAHEIAEGEVGVEFILKLDVEEPARGGIECRLHPQRMAAELFPEPGGVTSVAGAGRPDP